VGQSDYSDLEENGCQAAQFLTRRGLAEFFCVDGFEDHESRCTVIANAYDRSEVTRDNEQVGPGSTGLKGEE
jgi:hypothetical protein